MDQFTDKWVEIATSIYIASSISTQVVDQKKKNNKQTNNNNGLSVHFTWQVIGSKKLLMFKLEKQHNTWPWQQQIILEQKPLPYVLEVATSTLLLMNVLN